MNPYKILDIDRNPTKHDIVIATARALREKKYTSREIALAQKELMNPISKTVNEFLCFINIKPFTNNLNLSQPDVKIVPELEYLPIFNSPEPVK
ncbi:MAG: hypothetical protein V1753_11145 [Pseudomonadota bacterium]